jgi:Flp pilus assembly protein TadG
MRNRKGHAVLELALSAGVMVTILGGTFQYGYSFYVYNQLVTAVGNGARYAAQRTYRSADSEDIEKGREAIRNMVVFGDSHPLSTAVPVIPHLKPADVEVEWIAGENGAPEAVAVRVKEYKVDAVFGDVTLSGCPAVEFPFVGRYAPEEREP